MSRTVRTATETSKVTIRNFIGRVRVETGSMGIGAILVVEDKKLGDYPLASVNIPLHTQSENLAVAEYLAEAWNTGIRCVKQRWA